MNYHFMQELCPQLPLRLIFNQKSNRMKLSERFEMRFKKDEKETFTKIAKRKQFSSLAQYIRFLLYRDNGLIWYEEEKEVINFRNLFKRLFKK